MDKRIPIEKFLLADTLVLCGASINGLVLLGCLQYLEDKECLHRIQNYVGTSSGGMLCYLLALGYKPIEIMSKVISSGFTDRLCRLNLVAILQGSGASSYAPVQEFLENMTIEKIGYLPTLQQLKERLGKSLTVCTYDITESMRVDLSHVTHPEMPCLVAIRMTSSLPFFFDKFRWGNSFYTDGCICNNFPIDIGDSLGTKVIGIDLMRDNQKGSIEDEDPNPMSLFYKLVTVPIAQVTMAQIERASDKCIVLKIRVPLRSVYDMNVSHKEKLDMFSNGYQEMITKTSP